MHTRKMCLAFLAATFLFAAVGNASAGRLSTSSTTFRITWAALEFESSAGTVRCQVTLEGSYHSRTIAKVREALVGYVTRATVNSAGCTGGRVSAMTETLPWHIRYSSFTGTLPRITEVTNNLINGGFRVTAGGASECRWGITIVSPMRVVLGLAMIGSGIVEVLRGIGIIPIRGEVLCEIQGNGNINGEGAATVLGATTKITVTLI